MANILVLDDQEDYRKILQEALEGKGYSVVLAREVDEALLKLRLGEEAIDMAMLDLDMPGQDGFETLERIVEINAFMPVIVIASLEDDDSLCRALALGASDYILKPLTDQILTVSLPLRIANLMRYKNAIEEARYLRAEFEGKIKRYVSEGTWRAISGSQVDIVQQDIARREITVMFIDIMDFTALSERESADKVVFFLNSVFRYMADAVISHGGDIDKYIGDAIMAVFDSAEDAVQAARKILFDILPDFNDAHTEGFPEFLITVGVGTGLAVEGDVGGASRRERTFIGDCVNVAARLQQRAAPNSVLISEATYRQIKNRKGFEKMRPLRLKGKTERTQVYQLSAPFHE